MQGENKSLGFSSSVEDDDEPLGSLSFLKKKISGVKDDNKPRGSSSSICFFSQM
jgi:hypothetical protein